MSSANSDRNLLFGVLALQMDFLDRDALVAGLHAWVLDKTRPLGEILVAQRVLNLDERDVLDALVQKHLDRHRGDVEKSLAAVAVPSPLCQQLRSLADPDMQASLSRLPTPACSVQPPSLSSTTAQKPSVVGQRYHVLRPHDKGGIGEVFVALDQELNREVALKEIQVRHASDTHSCGRFVREAEITGGLEHPGIVPVYGLGQYADGRPYYAMRFIRGQTLKDAIAHQHRSNAAGARSQVFARRALLTRFVAVCNTLAYAHSRGVIHRDVKPANIMLGKYGETLVVDWGMAKAVAEDGLGSGHGADGLAEAALVPRLADSVETQAGAAMGTPAYMSREQAAGRLDLLGPASDIYSLGATLYTLLTGRPPIEGKDTAEVLRKAERGDWLPARQVKADVPVALAAICQKAMAATPMARYATALELAADVEHWLADEPVSAWREPLRLRAGRWTRRHQSLVGGLAAGMLVFLLLSGAGALWWGRERERQRAAAESALERVEILQQQSRLEEARAILKPAQERLGGFASADLLRRLNQASADLDLMTRLDAVRLERASIVAGGTFDHSGADRKYAEVFAEAGLGAVGEDEDSVAQRVTDSGVREALVTALDSWADAAQEKARRGWILGVLRRIDPHPLRDRLRDPVLWEDQEKLARIVGQVNGADLTPALAEALGVRLSKRAEGETLLRQAQQTRPADFWLAFYLGYVTAQKGKPGEAVGYLRVALALRPDNSLVCSNLGTVLDRQEKTAEAEQLYRQAIALDPRLALAHNNLGYLLVRQGKTAEAEQLYRQAIALDPRLALAYTNLGKLILGRQGKASEAEKLFRTALALYPIDALAHSNLGTALDRQGKTADAEKLYRQALNLDPTLALAHNNLGYVLERKGETAEAEKLYRKAIDLDSTLALAHTNLGTVLGRQGKTAEAEKLYRKAINLDFRDALAHNNLGYLLERQGKTVEAEKLYRQAIDLDPQLALAHTNLGALLERLGKWAEAASAYRKAIALGDRSTSARARLPQLQRMEALEPKLSAYVTGELRPLSNDDRLALAFLCQFKRLHRAAARFYGDAFVANAERADDMQAEHRYNAACCAALAGCGKGEDAGSLDDKELLRLRQQAQGWLRADLVLWGKQMESGTAQARAAVQKTLAYWNEDTDLAGVRDQAALAKLSAAERAGWHKLWADVEVMLKKAAEQGRSKPSVSSIRVFQKRMLSGSPSRSRGPGSSSRKKLASWASKECNLLGTCQAHLTW